MMRCNKEIDLEAWVLTEIDKVMFFLLMMTTALQRTKLQEAFKVKEN